MKKYLLIIFLLAPLIIVAQSDEIPLITNKFLIRNANVIVSPGQLLPASSILVEDGIITNVGSNITPPFDAMIIDADSMYIYAGFIAGLSHIGVPTKEAPKDLPKIKDPGNPPNDRAGITPDISLRDVLDVKDKSVAAYRKQGITLSHSVPKGRMLPGKGSLIVLNGSSVDDMLIAEDVSMFATLSGASRMYPGTVMAVMAKYRDLFKKAALASDHEKTYNAKSIGVKRPSYDKSIKALYPVVKSELPVFFSVEKTRDIQRAMRLQKELNFKIVPSEIKQGWLNIDKLKKQPIMLSLNLPKEIKEDKKEKKKSKKDEESEETKLFNARKKQSYDQYVGQAKLLNEEGISYSFSLLNTKAADIQKNLKRLVENGLSEDVALAAMTINPAKSLGIDNIAGTIAKDKLANLVITTKPYFEKDSKIKYVFVEGAKFEYEIKDKKKTNSDSTATQDLSGEYSYAVEIPGMTQTGKMILTKTEDAYTIVITAESSSGDPSTIENVEPDGNDLNFDFEAETQGATMKVNMAIEFDEDTFEGKVSVGDFGSFPVTGEKINPKF